MKNRFLTAIIICMMVLLVGCGSSNIDTTAVSERLKAELTYSDELYQVSEDYINNYVDMEEGVTAVMYMGSGITADQLAIFTCPDAATAQTQEEHIKAFAEEQRASFANYIPVEAGRLEDAVLLRKGRYVFFSVSDTPDLAKSIINSAF